MKAWVKTVGTVATLGTLAPLALAATWVAIDGRLWNQDIKAGDEAERHALAGRASSGDGLLLRRAISSTRSGAPSAQLPVPAASGQLTLAAFEGRGLSDPARVIFVENGGAPGLVLLANAGDGNSEAFGIFKSRGGNGLRAAAGQRAGGLSLGSMIAGAGVISGSGGGGSGVFPPDALNQLRAAGSLGGTGPTGGIPGFGGHEVPPQVAPLPPAILAFLSGLAALFAFRRVRGRAAEPAAH